MKPCPLCQGQGADETGRPCPDCNGQGETNNAAGIQNLRLHAAEHQKFIQQAQQAAQQAQAAMIAATHPKATESWKPALPGAAPA